MRLEAVIRNLLIRLLIISLCSSGALKGQSVPGQRARSSVELGDRFGRLKSWVGRYPTDNEDPSKHFWNLPEVKLPLIRMLGRKDFDRLSGRSVHSVEGPVSMHDNYLFASNCQYHCCSCRSSLLVIDLRDGTMYAIFRNLVGANSRELVRWVSRKGSNTPLPKGLCKFDEVGVPEWGCRK